MTQRGFQLSQTNQFRQLGKPDYLNDTNSNSLYRFADTQTASVIWTHRPAASNLCLLQLCDQSPSASRQISSRTFSSSEDTARDNEVNDVHSHKFISARYTVRPKAGRSYNLPNDVKFRRGPPFGLFVNGMLSLVKP
mgnify:CR=1 FL=1